MLDVRATYTVASTLSKEYRTLEARAVDARERREIVKVDIAPGKDGKFPNDFLNE